MPRLQTLTMPVTCLLATLALVFAGAARAQAQAYALDPVHTRILVEVDHAGFSTALGTISGATGVLHYTPGDWSGASVQVEVPLQRLDFGDEAWNRATLARNLLDAERHPVATFTSTRVEPVDQDRAIVHGVLDLRGVRRDVALDVRVNAARRHPLPPFRRTVGFSATTALPRAEFGVDAWPSMIGEVVRLRIEAEATRTRGASGTDDDADTPAPGSIPTHTNPTPQPESPH